MNKSETKNCQSCKNSFQIFSEDFAFYEKIDVPPPTFCSTCRLKRRIVFRNERSLYKRPCDMCKEDKVGMFRPEDSHTVYCHDCWWSDGWGGSDYARDYDFSRPFFEQMAELFKAVPRPGMIRQGNSVNSEYTNRVTDQYNSYLNFAAVNSEFCYYGNWFNNSKDCVDGYNVMKSERCYENIDCYNVNMVMFSQECHDCNNSAFLFGCTNVMDSFGCVNLRNKKHCWFNEQLTKEEYEKKLEENDISKYSKLLEMKRKFEEHKKKFIVPSLVTHRSVNSSGNWLENCKNTFRSFTVDGGEDCRYVYAILDGKDCMDHNQWAAGSEKIYECINVGIQCGNIKFGNECWSQLMDSEYVSNCHNSSNLFGCVGMRNAKYCILNKQYTKEEYEKLVPKIREHMNSMPYTSNGGLVYKYGEFFPEELSPHAYNESHSQEFYPLTKEEAIAKGLPWKDVKKREHVPTVKASELGDEITEDSQQVLKEIYGCAHEMKCKQMCTGAFKIVPHELELYKVFDVPLPRLCPNCRHFERLAMRNPYELWERKCQCAGTEDDSGVYSNLVADHPDHDTTAHCPNEFETSYSPDRSEIVYCKKCYDTEVV